MVCGGSELKNYVKVHGVECEDESEPQAVNMTDVTNDVKIAKGEAVEGMAVEKQNFDGVEMELDNEERSIADKEEGKMDYADCHS